MNTWSFVFSNWTPIGKARGACPCALAVFICIVTLLCQFAKLVKLGDCILFEKGV